MPFSIDTHRKERIKGKRTERGRRTLPAVRGKGLSVLFFLLSHLLKDSLVTLLGWPSTPSNTHTNTLALGILADYHGWLPDVIFPPEQQLKPNKVWIPTLIVLIASRELLFLLPCTHTAPHGHTHTQPFPLSCQIHQKLFTSKSFYFTTHHKVQRKMGERQRKSQLERVTWVCLHLLSSQPLWALWSLHLTSGVKHKWRCRGNIHLKITPTVAYSTTRLQSEHTNMVSIVHQHCWKTRKWKWNLVQSLKSLQGHSADLHLALMTTYKQHLLTYHTCMQKYKQC